MAPLFPLMESYYVSQVELFVAAPTAVLPAAAPVTPAGALPVAEGSRALGGASGRLRATAARRAELAPKGECARAHARPPHRHQVARPCLRRAAAGHKHSDVRASELTCRVCRVRDLRLVLLLRYLLRVRCMVRWHPLSSRVVVVLSTLHLSRFLSIVFWIKGFWKEAAS